jgi:hypothetical protein
MPSLPTTCPSCRSALAVSRLKCTNCGTAVEGEFEVPALLRLADTDLEFVTRFVTASGSLKDVAAHYGLSYPTVRNRLNQIISQLSSAADDRSRRRLAILDAIANGTLSVSAGEQQLKELAE